MVGDFNIDLNPKDKMPTTNMNKISNLCNLFGFEQLINDCTRVNDRSSTLIDHIYTNMQGNHKCSGVVKTALSDHYMTYTIIANKNTKHKSNDIQKRGFKHFKQSSFLHDLRSESAKLELHNDGNMTQALDKVKSCYNPLRLGTAIVLVSSGIDFVNTPRLYSDRATR